ALDNREPPAGGRAALQALDGVEVATARDRLPLARDQVPGVARARERGRRDRDVLPRIVEPARARPVILSALEALLEDQVAGEREDPERASGGEVREPQIVIAHQPSL